MRGKLYIKAKTALQLGLPSILRALYYRFQSKKGVFLTTCPILLTDDSSPLFIAPAQTPKAPINLQNSSSVLATADKLVAGVFCYFDHYDHAFKGPPEWHYDPFNDQYIDEHNHWSKIDEFSLSGTDIKILWELSRFQWAPILAEAYVLTLDEKYLTALNNYLIDWRLKNPANQGIQWKCGQETSIRLLHTLVAALILGQDACLEKGIAPFILDHLKRIEPTTHYAQAQRNNHLTSEAAALLIGGQWLERLLDKSDPNWAFAQKCHQKGMRLLDWAANTLIYDDGSFAQHSVTYHRVMLDTYSTCQAFIEGLGFRPLCQATLEKVKKAAHWLFIMTDPLSGDAPNLGSNDGAHLFNLAAAPYRDFRPCVQTAYGLFFGHKAYNATGLYDDRLVWFGQDPTALSQNPLKRSTTLFEDGGYYVHVDEKHPDRWVLLRLPKFLDRPAQSDILHIDIWQNGRALLCDSGTFSYNAKDGEVSKILKGVEGHNTLQFGTNQQMPVVSRFLYGCWVKGSWQLSDKGLKARYKDIKGNLHQREIAILDDQVIIHDHAVANDTGVTLRWHIDPSLNEQDTKNALKISRNDGTIVYDNMPALFSKYYLKKEENKVILATIDDQNIIDITTTFNFLGIN